MARTGTDKNFIEKQMEVIKKNNKIAIVLAVALLVLTILLLATEVLQLKTLLK